VFWEEWLVRAATSSLTESKRGNTWKDLIYEEAKIGK